MEFRNEGLNHMNKIEQLTESGFEIYENDKGVIFINHNEEIDLYGFIGAYMDYSKITTVKNWNPYSGYHEDDFEIIKVEY